VDILQSFLCDELGRRDCERVVGYLAVYRIMFAIACFYFLFFVTMLFVRNSRDPRSYIQNGLAQVVYVCIVSLVSIRFWFFKWFLLIGMIIGFFFIPVNGDLAFSKGIVCVCLCVCLGVLLKTPTTSCVPYSKRNGTLIITLQNVLFNKVHTCIYIHSPRRDM